MTHAAASAGRRSAPAETPRVAIAIGTTTFDALMAETDMVFFDTISLPEPTPEAFGFVVAHVDLGRGHDVTHPDLGP